MLKESNKAEKEILFGDFAFRKDIEPNVTIRRGVKWYGAHGDYIAKPSTQDSFAARKRQQKIRIIATEIYHFMDLPARVITCEHIVECMNYDNLLLAMEKAYKDFDIREYVTAVYFYLIDDE